MILFNEWMCSQSKTRLYVKLSLDITKKTQIECKSLQFMLE